MILNFEIISTAFIVFCFFKEKVSKRLGIAIVLIILGCIAVTALSVIGVGVVYFVIAILMMIFGLLAALRKPSCLLLGLRFIIYGISAISSFSITGIIQIQFVQLLLNLVPCFFYENALRNQGDSGKVMCGIYIISRPQYETYKMEIVNIVVSGSFNQNVDLKALMALGDVYSYDPEMYHAGYVKLSSAKATVYRSGKYIIPGIKSLELIQQVWKELVSVLSPHLDVTLFEPPAIRNMVAKDEIGSGLPMVQLQTALAAEGAEYEPEVFPGLMWTTEYGSVNIFKNGKFMLLGCKTVEELKKLDAYVKQKVDTVLREKT